MKKRRTRLALWREKTLLGIFSDVGNFLLFAMRRFVADGMSLSAGALTYSTLLALVPLLVIAFAVLSGFPAFDTVKLRMEELVLGALVPEVGIGAKSYLTDFTHNASNLTAVGIVALALAAVLLLSTIEATLNRIWRVEQPRSLGKRLLIFWALLTGGPLLFAASFTFTSDLMVTAQEWAWGTGDEQSLQFSSASLKMLFAILIQSLGLTLLYKLVPARHVRFRDAAIGGFFSGVALQFLRFGFNLFLTSSSTYTTIYGAVAIIPIFLLWLYSCWTVIIMGAVFASSFPDWWRRRDALAGIVLGPADRLELAMALLTELARQAESGGSMAQSQLADSIPLDARDEIINALRTAGYLVVTDDDRLSLSRNLNRATIADLARDLGVTLGRVADGKEQPKRRWLRSASLAKALGALGVAESTILNSPIAEALEPSTEKASPPATVPLRKSS